MKRISAYLIIFSTILSSTPILALPLEAIAIIAVNLAPYMGAKHSHSAADSAPSPLNTSGNNNKEDTANLKEQALQTIRIFQEQTARERTELIERFTNARKKVFGEKYFEEASKGQKIPWREGYRDNGFFTIRIRLILDQVDDKTLMTTLGLYYYPSFGAHKNQAILLQKRRIELPKSNMPLPTDANYNNDQTYIRALTKDIESYYESSLDTIEAHIKNRRDPIEMYCKETQLIQSDR